MQETVLGASDSRSTASVPQPSRPAARSTHLLVRSVRAATFILVIFPSVDLTITRIFADGHGLPLSENPFLKAVRDLNRQGLIYLLPLMVLAIGLHAFLPRKIFFCPPHKA